jgi:hypothetical protein
MTKGGHLHVQQASSQSQLHSMANSYGTIRTGSTANPAARASGYRAEGYSGTMYVAPTTNMHYAENRLLSNSMCHNVHHESNATSSPGYVYVIKGKKF